MTLEELKYKRKSAAIIFFTAGLAGLSLVGGPVAVWRSNIFRGTSFYEGPMKVVCGVISFCFLASLVAIPMFIISFFRLIHYSILIRRAKRKAKLEQQYREMPMSISGNKRRKASSASSNRSRANDIFNARYFLRDAEGIFGPLTIEDLVQYNIQENTQIAMGNPSNWKYAVDIPDLLETINYVRS